MDIQESYKKVCRLCLKNDGFVSIFTKDDGKPFSEMLFAVAAIKLVPGTTEVHKMCSVCLCRLREAFLFRVQCLQTQDQIINCSLSIKSEMLVLTSAVADDTPSEVQECWIDSPDRDVEDDLSLAEAALLLGREKKQKSKKQSRCKKKSHKSKHSKKKTLDFKQMRKLELFSQVISDFGIEGINIPTNQLAIKREIDKCNLEIEENCKENGECDEFKSSDTFVIKEEYELKAERSRGEKTIEELYEEAEKIELIETEPPVKKKSRVKKKGQFFCDVCGHCVKVKWDLISHFRIHTGEKPYKCSFCEYRCANSSGMTTHMKRHSGERPFVCDVCGKALASRDTLASHERIHTGELPYPCPVCGRHFRAKPNLRLHLRIHSGIKKFSCPICAKLFYTGADMKDHMRRHSGERPFACTLCPRRFTGIASQRTHMKLHTGQKDFKCQLCPKTFVCRESMRRHELVHTNKKAFECFECGSKFTHRKSLSAHQAKHSKSKDFVCNICDQRFGYAGSLYVHRKRKHNIQPSRIVTPSVQTE